MYFNGSEYLDPRWLAQVRASRALQKLNHSLERDNAEAIAQQLQSRMSYLQNEIEQVRIQFCLVLQEEATPYVKRQVQQ